MRSLKVLCSSPKLQIFVILFLDLLFDVNFFFFFRLTKCTFHKYGHSGTIEKHDALCLLALNIISEKIYVFVWFWLIILAVLTAGYMIYTIAVIAIPSMRKIMLQVCNKFLYVAPKVILKCQIFARCSLLKFLRKLQCYILSRSLPKVLQGAPKILLTVFDIILYPLAFCWKSG